ncbi:MAG: tyrosine-type recombinase/integrase [Pyrinomonadaceae bacterium]
MAGAQEPGAVSTKQQRIARLGARYPSRAFTSLAHVMDLEWMREATLGLELPVPELGTSVFIVPAHTVKNRMDRLVVLNRVAKSVVDSVRGEHTDHVFTFDGHRILRINNSAWRKARKRAQLSHVRVHDLKHTFGRRLRAAGVSFEDRQDLLGHKSGRITTHYSAAELTNLVDASRCS